MIAQDERGYQLERVLVLGKVKVIREMMCLPLLHCCMTSGCSVLHLDDGWHCRSQCLAIGFSFLAEDVRACHFSSALIAIVCEYPVVIIACCSECSLLQQCFRIRHLIILISVSDVAETLQFRGTWAQHPIKDLAVFHIAAKSLQVPWDWDEGRWTWLNVNRYEGCPYYWYWYWYVQISTHDDLNSLHSGFDKLHSLECCVNRVKCSILLVL